MLKVSNGMIRAVGMDDVDAGFLHRAHVEVLRVHELDDEHAEDLVVGHRSGTATSGRQQSKFAQGRGRLGRVGGREELED